VRFLAEQAVGESVGLGVEVGEAVTEGNSDGFKEGIVDGVCVGQPHTSATKSKSNSLGQLGGEDCLIKLS